MSHRIHWSRAISAAVGYTIAGCVVFHFLTHTEPWHTADLILAAFGMVGLNLGIGKNVVDGLDAVTRFVGTVRSGWTSRTGRTSEHPTRLPEPAPATLAPPARVAGTRKRKKPPKGSIAHRSSAQGKPKRPHR